MLAVPQPRLSENTSAGHHLLAGRKTLLQKKKQKKSHCLSKAQRMQQRTSPCVDSSYVEWFDQGTAHVGSSGKTTMMMVWWWCLLLLRNHTVEAGCKQTKRAETRRMHVNAMSLMVLILSVVVDSLSKSIKKHSHSTWVREVSFWSRPKICMTLIYFARATDFPPLKEERKDIRLPLFLHAVFVLAETILVSQIWAKCLKRCNCVFCFFNLW